jgi:hypothetical protein
MKLQRMGTDCKETIKIKLHCLKNKFVIIVAPYAAAAKALELI